MALRTLAPELFLNSLSPSSEGVSGWTGGGASAFRPAMLRLAADPDFPEAVGLINGSYRGESSRVGWTSEDYIDGERTTLTTLKADLAASPNAEFLLLRDTPRGPLLGCVWAGAARRRRLVSWPAHRPAGYAGSPARPNDPRRGGGSCAEQRWQNRPDDGGSRPGHVDRLVPAARLHPHRRDPAVFPTAILRATTFTSWCCRRLYSFLLTRPLAGEVARALLARDGARDRAPGLW